LQYLTLDEFRVRTRLPIEYVNQAEQASPGYVDACLQDQSSYIDSRLFKRYATPFKLPYPIAVIRWVVQLVTLDVWLKRGFNPTDLDAQVYRDLYNTAITELAEAANAETGLFELPLRADTEATGIHHRTTRSYTQSSPYVWKRDQYRRGRTEDRNGGGTIT